MNRASLNFDAFLREVFWSDDLHFFIEYAKSSRFFSLVNLTLGVWLNEVKAQVDKNWKLSVMKWAARCVFSEAKAMFIWQLSFVFTRWLIIFALCDNLRSLGDKHSRTQLAPITRFSIQLWLKALNIDLMRVYLSFTGKESEGRLA